MASQLSFEYTGTLSPKIPHPSPGKMKSTDVYFVRYRSVVVDWLREVTNMWKAHHETLVLAVYIFDHVLAAKDITKNHLQLYGSVSMWIAHKYVGGYDEHDFDAEDINELSNKAYTEDLVSRTEIEILKIMNWYFGMGMRTDYVAMLVKTSTACDQQWRDLYEDMTMATLLSSDSTQFTQIQLGAATFHLTNQLTNGNDWGVEQTLGCGSAIHRKKVLQVAGKLRVIIRDIGKKWRFDRSIEYFKKL